MLVGSVGQLASRQDAPDELLALGVVARVVHDDEPVTHPVQPVSPCRQGGGADQAEHGCRLELLHAVQLVLLRGLARDEQVLVPVEVHALGQGLGDLRRVAVVDHLGSVRHVHRDVDQRVVQLLPEQAVVVDRLEEQLAPRLPHHGRLDHLGAIVEPVLGKFFRDKLGQVHRHVHHVHLVNVRDEVDVRQSAEVLLGAVVPLEPVHVREPGERVLPGLAVLVQELQVPASRGQRVQRVLDAVHPLRVVVVRRG